METNQLYYSHTFYVFYSWCDICYYFIHKQNTIFFILLSFSPTLFVILFIRDFSYFIVFIFDYFPFSIIILMLFFSSYYSLFVVWVFLFSSENKEWKILIYFLVRFHFVLLCFVVYKQKRYDVEHFHLSNNNWKS